MNARHAMLLAILVGCGAADYENNVILCQDGEDNDRDGLVDLDDPGCGNVEICDDGVDNNGNGWVDTADIACIPRESCSDGVDNNDDGLVDCQDPQCVATCNNIGGRPLLDAAGPVTAPAAERRDWLGALDHLDVAPHPVLAAHWARMAAFEHASVASFARVTLELMALGVPAELLADTQAAAADEVRHAQLCFALATAYGGAPIGPGPLPIADLGLRTDPEAVLVALIDEACIGETLSALEAAEAAERCEDPVLQRILTAIAEDEQRHAELGWRTLSWLLDAHPELVPVARERFRAYRPAPPEPGPRDLEAQGLLAPATVLKARLLGLREVVLPAVEAIVGVRAA